MRLFFIALLFPITLLSQKPNYKVSSIADSLLLNADAVVREDFIDIKIETIDKMEIRTHQAVTIMNEDGDSFSRLSVGYDEDLKIKSVSARIYDKNGEEIKEIKRKDFKDFSAVDGMSLYTDNRVLAYKHLIQEYPITIVFDYQIDTKDTGVIPSWFFVPGYDVSVEKSRYQVTFSDSLFKPKVIEKNLEGHFVKSRQNGQSISYEVSNIIAVKHEILSPSFDKIAPRLMVNLPNFNYKNVRGNINNWNDVGVWINDLLEGQDELSNATITKIRELVKNHDDALERAKIVHQYVQENTRYISVQVGIGGLKPISAIEVDRVKYGDCKGLTNYMKALLKAVDVPSYYVIVQAGQNKVDFLDDFADLGQGNHVILTIPYKEEYYWIDCTSQVHPFGYIGDFTDDRQVLVVKSEGGELMKTAAYLNEANGQKTTANVLLNADGSFAAEVEIETTGIQYDRHFVLENQNEDDVVKYYKGYWENIENLKINDFSFDNNKSEILFKENVQVSASDYAIKTENQLIFSPNLFNSSGYAPKRYRNRKQPFEIQRGYLDEDYYNIELPEGREIEVLPENVTIETKFGSYLMNYTTADNAIILKRRFLLRKGFYPADDYEKYRKFRRQVLRTDNTKIIITSKK